MALIYFKVLGGKSQLFVEPALVVVVPGRLAGNFFEGPVEGGF